jgi:hypothetical protein
MKAQSGRKVLSRGPLTSIHFWSGSVFILVATLPIVPIFVRHGSRISTEAFEWMMLGIAAAWLFLFRVWLFHSRLHQYVANLKPEENDVDFLLNESATLAYSGLSMIGFAVLGLLFALWRVAGTH